MGTRSLTKVYEHGKVVVCMYRQFDGYPTGHGAELSEFLNQFAAITNGIAFGETRKTANGMGCLAAQMVGHFKTEAGGFYLYPTGTVDVGEEYVYHVHQDRVVVQQVHPRKKLFDGSWDAFTEFCQAVAV